MYHTINTIDIKFWRLCFLQLYAILLFTVARFSLINTSLAKPNVFPIIKCLFGKFSIIKTENCFFETILAFSNSMTSFDVIGFYVDTNTVEHRNNFFLPSIYLQLSREYQIIQYYFFYRTTQACFG